MPRADAPERERSHSPRDAGQEAVRIADGIALTIPIVLAGAGLVLLFVGYRTRKKEDKTLWYVLGVAALAGFAVTGGYITFASAPSQQAPPPTAPAGIWKATFAAFTDASSEIATTIISPDATHVDLYIVHGTYGGATGTGNPTTWNATINVFNMNQATQNTQPYLVQLSYGSVYSVQSVAAGTSYPALGVLSDGKTFNVVWSAVSSAPTPTVISPGTYQASFTSLQNGQEKAVLTLNRANFGAMTVGNVYELDLTVGGITLPIFVHPTS